MLRSLGSSDLRISPLGLGTWALGGDGPFGWGPQEDADSIAAIRRAVERGLNWIDTAPIYGFGHSEIVVAKALKELRGAHRPYVFTKCGLVWDETRNGRHCLKADSVRREVEASLSRLGVDVLDLCQIHWPAFPPGAPAPDIEEGWEALVRLKEERKIRHLGVSNFDAGQMERLRAIAPPTSLQPPYSMLMRQIEPDILPYCRRQGMGVLAYSPMHNGLLSGRMTRERIRALPPTDWRGRFNPAFREPALSRNLALVEVLRDVGARHGRAAGEVAIAWTLRDPVVTGAIVGARDPGQVDGFAGALSFRLGEEEIREIERSLPESIEPMRLA